MALAAQAGMGTQALHSFGGVQDTVLGVIKHAKLIAKPADSRQSLPEQFELKHDRIEVVVQVMSEEKDAFELAIRMRSLRAWQFICGQNVPASTNLLCLL